MRLYAALGLSTKGAQSGIWDSDRALSKPPLVPIDNRPLFGKAMGIQLEEIA